MITIALTTDVPAISFGRLEAVAAALNIHLAALEGAWDVAGNVQPYLRPDEVPTGAWPVLITDQLHEPGLLGIHLDTFGLPYASVEYGPNWSVTACHEISEMLVDPTGTRTIAAPSPNPHDNGRPVDYLVEVCDPCERLSYKVGPYRMSDIVFESWYTGQALGIRRDLLGKLLAPRQLAEGGYVSYRDPETNHWHQGMLLYGELSFRDLGLLDLQPGKRLAELMRARLKDAVRHDD